MKGKKLGKGLDYLLGEALGSPVEPSIVSAASSSTMDLPVKLIRPNPFQPRKAWESAEIEELAASIREQGLIQNERLEEYDGTTAVVRTRHLTADEVEFLRWKAERWMKTRHVPAVFRHDPWFVLTHSPKMLAHTFRGSSIRSALGLEDERKVFSRYKAIREAERQYV